MEHCEFVIIVISSPDLTGLLSIVYDVNAVKGGDVQLVCKIEDQGHPEAASYVEEVSLLCVSDLSYFCSKMKKKSLKRFQVTSLCLSWCQSMKGTIPALVSIS